MSKYNRETEVRKAKESIQFLKEYSNGFIRVRCEDRKEFELVQEIYKELGYEEYINRIEFLIAK